MKEYLKLYKIDLIGKDLVRQNQVPYMVWWVKHYLSMGQPEEAMYADILQKEGKKDWQIRQTLEAVKIYCSIYLGDSEEAAVTGLAPLDEEKSDEVFRDYLTHLALKRKVASSTQNQAFNAILFLFRNVWSKEPVGIDAVRARVPKRLPAVLTPDEVRKVLKIDVGLPGLIMRLIYSSGIRLSEALNLRVQDLDLQNCSLTVRSGKGDKDRVTVMGSILIPLLQKQIEIVRSALGTSNVPVSLPSALERKYQGAGLELSWKYVFPSSRSSVDPSTGNVRRHHIHPSCVQKGMKKNR